MILIYNTYPYAVYLEILAELERLKADLDCTEEESTFLGKELANAKIAIQEIRRKMGSRSTSPGRSQRSSSLPQEVSTGAFGGIFCA